MSKKDHPIDVEITVVGEDELQRLTAVRFPSGAESNGFFNNLGPSEYWNNLVSVVVDARKILAEIMGAVPDFPPDPNNFDAFSGGWYAATCWGYADALLLRDDASLEHKLAWSQMLGAAMTEWDWRLHYKSHIVRGVNIQKGASAGGRARGRNFDTSAIISYIETHKDKLGVSRAAEVAFRQANLGASPAANRQIWNREQTKRKKAVQE